VWISAILVTGFVFFRMSVIPLDSPSVCDSLRDTVFGRERRSQSVVFTSTSVCSLSTSVGTKCQSMTKAPEGALSVGVSLTRTRSQ